jgi:hypothetical protein
MQVACAVGAQQREIGVGIDAEHAGIGDHALAVAQADLLRGADDVAVGQHQAVRRNDDAGAEPAALARIRRARAGFDANHRGADTFGDADHRIGIGVEQRLIVGGGCLGW